MMNEAIFRLINNLANQNGLLDQIMIFLSKDLWYFYIALVALLFAAGAVKRDLSLRKTMFSTFVFTVMNLAFSFLIGCLFYVDRPFVHNQVQLLYPHAADASFPSDHATGTMSISVGMAKYDRRLSAVLIILSVLVGFSRIYVGHHYPADIVGAYLLVFATGYIYNRLLRDKVEQLYETVEKKITRRFVAVKNS